MNDSNRLFDTDPASSYDGSDPARRLLRELPILRFPDDALESVFDATVRARAVAGKTKSRLRLAAIAVVATAAAALVLVGAVMTMTARDGDATAASGERLAASGADAESIKSAELGVRLAFGYTERTLARFPFLNLLKTTFSDSSERKR